MKPLNLLLWLLCVFVATKLIDWLKPYARHLIKPAAWLGLKVLDGIEWLLILIFERRPKVEPVGKLKRP